MNSFDYNFLFCYSFTGFREPMWKEVIFARVKTLQKPGGKFTSSEWSLPTKQWLVGQDCKTTAYLGTRGNSPTNWECVACPLGASCAEPKPWFGVHALFGWFRLPVLDFNHSNATQIGSPATFERCLFPGACLGAPNIELAKTYLHPDDPTFDFALQSNITESCNMVYGFKNASRLCHACRFNHRRYGRHRCGLCPASAEVNWIFMFLGAVITTVLLVGLVYLQVCSKLTQEI